VKKGGESWGGPEKGTSPGEGKPVLSPRKRPRVSKGGGGVFFWGPGKKNFTTDLGGNGVIDSGWKNKSHKGLGTLVGKVRKSGAPQRGGPGLKRTEMPRAKNAAVL